MLSENVMFDNVPERVVIEILPDKGRKRVLIRDNVKEPVDSESSWTADEAWMETAESVTEPEILLNFDAWLERASEWIPGSGKTIEARVSDLEVESSETREALEMILSGVIK